MTAFAIVGATIFDGRRMIEGHAVVVEDGRIKSVVEFARLERALPVTEVEGLLAPGLIDLQVNGGGGVLFNDRPTVDGIRAIGAAHRRFGTTGFLPTLITDSRDKMAEAVAAVSHGLTLGVPGLLGIHLEGPFINPERKGVHDAKFIRPIEAEDIRIVTSLRSGRVLVTLAPERVPSDAIGELAAAGVVVAAGHTMASYEALAEARRHGLTGFTHLFNAMPPLAGREPGPVGAALDLDGTWASAIVDLHHVSPCALRVAIAAKGPDGIILVTDAMPLAGSSEESFELQGRRIVRREGRLTTADGTLAGSDLDMASAVRNTVGHLGVGLAAALRMASLGPAAALRLRSELGKIAPGYRANLVLLDDGLRVLRTWIDGADGREEEAQ
ncbi:MAG TPA: N-acetylglucosamine-6-phosphate deacetylase [Propylenella sp.]